MNISLDTVKKLVTPEQLFSAVLYIAVLILVWFAFKLVHRFVMKYARKKCRLQTQQIISKTIRYSAFAIIAFSILNKLGVNLSALLGAAGIVGIAVGFAAQTTIANVISGLFIMTERSFESGDFITVDGVSGTVDSIDILSIKLRTPDNQLVRVPNETVIKSSVVNITRYPIRRLAIEVGVAYGTNLDDARRQLIDTALRCELTLATPAPDVQITGFGASAVNMQLLSWTNKENFLQYRTELIAAVHDSFKENGIEIAFPHLDVSLCQ